MNRYPSIFDELHQQLNAIEDELAKPEYQPDTMRRMTLLEASKAWGQIDDTFDKIQRACDEMRHAINQIGE